MRWLMVAAAAAATIVSVPAPAAAGGNFIDWDRDWYLPGQEVTGTMDVYVDDMERIQRNAPYFAYLMPDEGEWPEAPSLSPAARIVGWVEPLRKWHFPGGGWTWRTSTSFVAPVAAGDYHVVICDRPCTHRLGDVDASWLRVFTSPAEAAYVPKLEAAREKLVRLRERVEEQRDAVDAATARWESTNAYAEQLSDQIAVLEERLRGAGRAPAREASPAWAWLLAPAALLGYLLGRRMKRRAEPAPDPIDEVVEMLLVDQPELEPTRRP